MTKAQQQYVNTITERFYAKGAEESHAEYRELASRVYANALRNPETSLLELKFIFKPLQTIATSADFTENSIAVGRAITQPFADSAAALHSGQVFATVASTAIKLADDPLANIKRVWNGVQATTTAAYQLAQHATGVLTMDERKRLATIYDLPHAQRIQALHGVTLKDTAAMVSIGSLPGLLPNAMTKARVVVNETGAAMAYEIKNLPKYIGAYPVPALVGASVATESNLPSLPQVLSMATKDPNAGGSSADNSVKVEKKFNLADYEFPDPSYDHERVWYKEYLNRHVETLSNQMKSLGLKDEATQIKTQLDYMLNVQITSNASEYNLVLNAVKETVAKAEQADYQQALASGLSQEEIESRPNILTREFNNIQLYVEYERDKAHIDLAKAQNKLELQEKARLDPDSVGYARTVAPRNITEREMNHHIYLTQFNQSVADLRVKLELLGLNERADLLGDQTRELRAVSLESSKSIHDQRVANFMKIGEEAKNADIKNSSSSISERYFHMIQEGIGADIAHIKKEIGHDREYHIRDQLWRRQFGDERRASEGAEIAKARDELFGDNHTIVTQELGLER